MATEIKDLLVKISPEGIEDTTDQLERQGDQFEETADQVGESTDQLEGFATKWQGAMAAILGGLAVATAGLLSRVPVVGELMAGLEAVLAAVAFQMDQVLRPVIGPLTKGFLNFADSIFNLKGTAGDVVGVIGAVVAAITAVGSALLAASALGFSLSGAFGAISGAVSTVVGAVGTVIGILGGPLTLAILAVVALVAGLWKAWDENWFNIRGIVNSAIDAIVQAVGGFISSLGSAWEVFTSVLGTVWDGFWQFAINAAKRGANTIIGVVEDLVNRMVRTLPDFITEKLGIGEVSFGRFETRSTREIVGDVTGRGGGRGRGQSDQVDRLVAAMQNQDVTTVLELDSQTVARATEPFLGSGTANQGRVFRGR